MAVLPACQTCGFPLQIQGNAAPERLLFQHLFDGKAILPQSHDLWNLAGRLQDADVILCSGVYPGDNSNLFTVYLLRTQRNIPSYSTITRSASFRRFRNYIRQSIEAVPQLRVLCEQFCKHAGYRVLQPWIQAERP